MTPVLFLDLDGVIVDFVAGAFRAHGRRPPPPLDVRWGFPAQMGFTGTDDPAFWAPLGHDFWANLPWTAEGRAVVAAAEAAYGEHHVAVMTSPCDTPGSVEGKVAWVRREMPRYARRLFVGPAKHLAAGPGKLLVDDHGPNCERFAAAGGESLLVPRPWNARRGEVDALGRFDTGALAGEIMRARESAAIAAEWRAG